MVGNFIADFIRNKYLEQLDPGIQQGVLLHRAIDQYTDTHPLIQQGTKRLHARHSKYASVLIDVYYDYLLAKNWLLFHQKPLSEFTEGVYEVLMRHRPIMPPSLQRRLPHMVADDWLRGYGTQAGLEFTFERMKLRVSKPHYFENAFDSLEQNLEAFEEEFLRFFPEMIKFVAQTIPPHAVTEE